jgi:hypothetical protein
VAEPWLSDISGQIEDADYYECQQRERLEHETMADAIEAALEDLETDPETLFMTACKRQQIDIEGAAQQTVEDLIERLDEMFADPDADMTQPTEGMERAAKTFVAAVAAEYEVWMCDEVGSATVDVAKWRASRAGERSGAFTCSGASYHLPACGGSCGEEE